MEREMVGNWSMLVEVEEQEVCLVFGCGVVSKNKRESKLVSED